MLLGGIIGVDREIAKKPAGIRTNMLVAGAATLIIYFGDVIITHYNAPSVKDLVKADPAKIIQAVIQGISFIGAGTIIRNKSSHIEGVTTAATLLFSASIGIAVGLSQFALAVGATLLAMFTLIIFNQVDKLLKRFERKEELKHEEVPELQKEDKSDKLNE